MAEERVTIKVEIDVDGLSDVAKVQAAMRAIGLEQDRINRRSKSLSTSLDKVTRASTGLSRAAQGVVDGFGKLFSFIAKFNFVAMAADIGLVSLALGGVKLALAGGRFAVQAYQFALQGLGVAAAGVAGALGTVAAAVNEFSQVSLAPFVGGFKNAATAIRGTLGDDLLSFFGVEGLTGAVRQLAASGQIAASTFPQVLRGLGNFAQDSKQLQELAGIFSQISTEGKVTESILDSLISANPVFGSAIAEIASGRVLSGPQATEIAMAAAAAGEISAEEFNRALSGELQSTNPFEGQLERMNNTLQGQIQGLIARMTPIFATFGQGFLQPFREAIAEVEQIATFALVRLRRSVTRFGVESFIPGLVTAIEKTADFVVRMADEALPKLEGFATKVFEIFGKVENFFRNIGAILEPLEDGANVMMTLFGPFLRNLFGARGFGGLIMDSAEGFAENADEIGRLGEAMGEFAFQFMGIFRDIQDSFFDGSGTIAEFFEVLANDVMPVARELLGVFRDMMREALPVINSLLRDTAQILLPILSAIRELVGAVGPLGAGGFLGLMALKKGGLSPGRGFGIGAGGAIGGLPGAILGGILGGGAGKGLLGALKATGKRGAGFSGLAMGAGRHSAGLLGGMSTTGAIGAVGAGVGVPAFFGGQALSRSGMSASKAGAALGLGGGLAGAGAGAAIGALGGPIGIAAGALIGLIAGGIGGALGAEKIEGLQKQASEWTMEQMDAVTGEMRRLFSKGANQTGIDAARGQLRSFTGKSNIAQMATQFEMSFEQMEDIVEKGTSNWEHELSTRESVLDHSLDAISQVFDMTEQEILELADLMAVDLSDSFATFTQDLIDLGLALPLEEVASTITGLAEDSVLAAIFGPGSALGGAVGASAAAEMRTELDGLWAVLQSANQAGDIHGVANAMEEVANMSMAIAQTEFGTSGTGLMFVIEDIMQQLLDPTGRGFIGAGPGADLARATLADIEKERTAIMSGEHVMFEPLQRVADSLFQATGDERFKFDNIMKTDILPGIEQKGIEFIDQIVIGATEGLTSVEMVLVGAGAEFASTVRSAGISFSTSVSGAISGAISRANFVTRDANRHSGPGGPKKTNRGPANGDTATSRLNRAMGFHGALARRMGGKFQVTSGLRGWGLGSLSSDHLTGGAYDLVGNNLGQYANAVTDAGGFAEFHGRSASRHLHVVAPVGDSATPAQMGSNSGGGGMMLNVSMTINGAGDPEAVANLAVGKIQRLVQDYQERR